MVTTFLIAQIFGFLAMSLSVYAWQIKNPRMILLLYVPVGLLWASQYHLLGAYAGVAIALIGASKDLIVSRIDQKKAKKVILIFFVFVWGIGLLFVKSAIDILPLITTTIFNLALLQPDNRHLMARINILTQFLWIAFNLSVGAYMGVLCGFLLIGSTLVGLSRVEGWQLGRCYRAFTPNLVRALFVFPSFKNIPLRRFGF